MKFSARSIGRFCAVSASHESSVIDLGLFNPDEAAEFAQSLRDAAEYLSPAAEPLAERKMAAIIKWLEDYQPDVFQRGIWDAINEVT